jgi:hypothetical protein
MSEAGAGSHLSLEGDEHQGTYGMMAGVAISNEKRPSIEACSPGINLQSFPRHADKHSVETDYLTALAARLWRATCFP